MTENTVPKPLSEFDLARKKKQTRQLILNIVIGVVAVAAAYAGGKSLEESSDNNKSEN